MDNIFPVLIMVRQDKETKFKVVQAEGLPVDLPFEMVAVNATDEMKTLAVKMYNKGWAEATATVVEED